MAEEEIVVDASVAVKWFSNEEFTQEALKLREDHVEDQIEIVIPNLLLTELTNALRYNSHFTKEDVQKATQTLFDLQLQILAPSAETLNQATNISFELETTIYDSVYLALAEQLDCKCITTDEELVEKFENAEHLNDF